MAGWAVVLIIVWLALLGFVHLYLGSSRKREHGSKGRNKRP